jgi:hypothetical protein
MRLADSGATAVLVEETFRKHNAEVTQIAVQRCCGGRKDLK